MADTAEWMVVVGKDEGAWSEYAHVPLDPGSGWVEAWTGILDGYEARRYDSEPQANAAAQRLRAWGFITATEPAPADGA